MNNNDQIPPNRALEGIREAAEFMGVTRGTISNWLAKGLPHEVKTLGKHKLIVIQSDDLIIFNALICHKTGPKPKQA